MEATLKPYKIEGSNPLAIPSSRRQRQKACNSDTVLEGVTRHLLPFSMSTSLAAFLTVRLTPRKDREDKFIGRHGVAGQEINYGYPEAVDYLLNAYATDDIVEKVATKLEAYKQRFKQPALTIQNALNDNALACGDVISKQRTMSIFVD